MRGLIPGCLVSMKVKYFHSVTPALKLQQKKKRLKNKVKELIPSLKNCHS